MGQCSNCGASEKLIAKGLCHKCYGLDVEKRNSAICPGCNKYKPIKAKGLCRKCYMRLQRHGDPAKVIPRPVKGAKLCSHCHENPVHAKDLCGNCYARYLKNGSPERVKVKKVTECEYCGEVRLIRAHGFCGTCYGRYFRYGTPEFRERPTRIRECVVCGKTRKIAAKNVCTVCYVRYAKTGSLKQTVTLHTDLDPIGMGLPEVTKETVKRRRATSNKQMRVARKNHNRRFKSYSLKKFGITIEDYERMFKEQNGVCAICGNPETVVTNGEPWRLSVDHNHETGEVRGLLCTNCNNGLGRFKDSLDLFQKALVYLT